MTYRRLFIFAGILSVLIGVLHLVIIFADPDAYIFFGAGKEMAEADRSGSWMPDIITFCVALVFLVFGAYAFSGASWIRRLPALKFALLFIASIFTLRGLAVVADLLGYFYTDNYPFRNIIFSMVSLLVGFSYILAIIKGYDHLSPQTKKP